jgi:ubiquinol-cytochrome c reductase cytochrome b/c1 subunit
MMRRILIASLAALTVLLGAGATVAQDEQAQCIADIAAKNPLAHEEWDFNSIFGTYDQAALKRGFQVYKDVCSACHSMNLLSYRHLAGIGLKEDEIKAVAASVQVPDGPNDQGEMFERPGRLADRFPAPFPNEQAARARYGGYPVDQSVIAKARTYERGFPWFIIDALPVPGGMYQEHGVDYITALLQGYEDNPPAGVTVPAGTYYNKYFPGHAIAMPPPLTDGRVEYTDGAPQTVAQYAKDVAAFLMWSAEPHLEARKRIGFQVMVFLIVFAFLMWVTKKKVWHEVEAPTEAARGQVPVEGKP